MQTISPTSSLFIAQRSSTYSQGNMEKFWGENVRSTPTSITSGLIESSSTKSRVILSGGVAVCVCLLLSAHRAVTFAIAQLSCHYLLVVIACRNVICEIISDLEGSGGRHQPPPLLSKFIIARCHCLEPSPFTAPTISPATETLATRALISKKYADKITQAGAESLGDWPLRVTKMPVISHVQ